MANTYTSLHYHLIFSTKNRQPWIRPDLQPRIWDYLGGIARQNAMKSLQVGGIDDHVHLVSTSFPMRCIGVENRGFRHGSAGTPQGFSRHGTSLGC